MTKIATKKNLLTDHGLLKKTTLWTLQKESRIIQWSALVICNNLNVNFFNGFFTVQGSTYQLADQNNAFITEIISQ